jgi:hypothetical protein
VSKAEAEANDARQQTVAVVRGMLLLPTALAFLLWQYRAYANLRALSTRRPSRSPGGSVGVCFIPFANLVLPHAVIQELAVHSGEPGARSLRGLVLAWWLTFIGASVASRVAGVVLERSDGLDGLVAATRVQQVFHLLWAGSAVLAILVVRAVVRRQARRPDLVAAFD